MPRKIIVDDEIPHRRRRAPAVAIQPERGLVMRVLLHSPKDTLAGAAALAVVIGIITNALLLQSGHHHPAPMFSGAQQFVTAVPAQAPIPRMRPADAEVRPVDAKPVDAAPAPIPSKPSVSTAAPAAPRPPAAIPSGKTDPVGDLIVSNRRVATIQRALTEYGYGQIKPTGIVGADTQAAIQKFERDRKMPITGKISDKLIRDLVVLTGRPIE